RLRPAERHDLAVVLAADRVGLLGVVRLGQAPAASSAASREQPGQDGGPSGGAPHDVRRSRISSSSGKRPTCCFEKRSCPSAITSNWLFSPSVASAACPSPLSSAARLAARRS